MGAVPCHMGHKVDHANIIWSVAMLLNRTKILTGDCATLHERVAGWLAGCVGYWVQFKY
jgi:hypothetical protein